MSAWTDAVEALNPELWLKLDPVTPNVLVNSGSVDYPAPDQTLFWDVYDWTTSPFGVPGGVRGGGTFGMVRFTSPSSVNSRTSLAFFRWDGWNIIWNDTPLGISSNEVPRFTFSGRYIALYNNDFVLSSAPMENLLNGEWHMVGLSSDATTSKLYLDGTPILSAASSAGTDYKIASFFDYSGSYDECLSFHRVLTDAEIAGLWAAAINTGIVPQLKTYDMSGQRMALDVDGSIVTATVRAGEEIELSQAQKRFIMDESPNLVTLMCSVKRSPRITILFPEPRDLFGFFIAAAFGTNTGVGGDVDWFPVGYGTTIHVSRTSDGLAASDWTTVPISWGRGYFLGNPYFGVGTEYIDEVLLNDDRAGKVVTNFGYLIDNRLVAPTDLYQNSSLGVVQSYMDRAAQPDQIYAFDPPVRNVRGVRLYLSQLGWQGLGYMSPTADLNICVSLQGIYLYGQKSNSDIAVDHSLDIWQENRFAPMELKLSAQGMVALRSSQDFRFCVTNRSSRATARDITIHTDVLIDNAGAPLGSQFMFWSTADLSHKFYRDLPIGSLAPGEQSAAIVLRRVTPVDATEGVYIPRILAQVGWWD